VAVCVTGRKYSQIGGTPFSPSYTWSKDYEILPDETKCACDLYKQRNTGNNQWDQCPDCTFVCSFSVQIVLMIIMKYGLADLT